MEISGCKGHTTIHCYAGAIMLRFLALMLLLALCVPAMADDWSVERTRGQAMQRIDGSWIPLARGDVVPDNRLLKTGSDGRVGLRRGAESIEMGGDTQIRVHDAGDALMTTVIQDYGTVAVEAERRNVQHFSVQTPFLAAVVKGTRFTVTFEDDVAQVSVERGMVQVQDQLHLLVADITPGHDASVSRDEALAVSGLGSTPIYAFEGQTAVAIATTADSTSASHADVSGAGNGHNGNGNSDGAEDGNGNNGNHGDGNNGNGNSHGSENDNGNNGNHGDGNNGNGNSHGGDNENGNSGRHGGNKD
ncbi:MAG: FecR family protein [Devosia sp.]